VALDVLDRSGMLGGVKSTLAKITVFLFTVAVLLLVVFYVPFGWLLIPVLFVWASIDAIKALRTRAIRKRDSERGLSEHA
jgi:hypothetical protein